MKIKYFPLSLFLLLLLFSCGREQEKKDALAYYDIANMYYLNNQMDSAMFILDSLDIKFPNVLETKNMGVKLTRKIRKQDCQQVLDSLYTVENELKAMRRITEYKGGTREEILQYDLKLDSIAFVKEAYQQIYEVLDAEEYQRASCQQCVTRMQNARNGYDGPIY